MYPRSDRRNALDLWFKMLGEMSVEDFVDELGWSGFDAASFSALLDAWLSRYSTTRLKGFRVGSRTAYDTIGNRRKRLGFAA
ncbi:hypothetical protein QP551_06070 [Slackia exigua]|uniref:hypothetical protein n=1 Tax=Slackia exigua TaxID=84109 RepID=UPI00254AEE12|nr:hypothetical protein [Slackia exigua]MDK7724257.1 hypothetical protein [Slackia exigua]MDK7725586.1 hypothetical protein [Slackia exigua]